MDIWDFLISLWSNRYQLALSVFVLYLTNIIIRHIKLKLYFKKKGVRDLEFIKSIPFFGHGPFIPLDYEENFEMFRSKIYQQQLKYPKEGSCVIWALPTYALRVRYSGETIKEVVTSKQYIEKSYEYKFLADWFGQSLFQSKYALWSKRRRMISPAFHGNVLNGYGPTMNDSCTSLVNQIDKKVGKDFFDIEHFCGLWTFHSF